MTAELTCLLLAASAVGYVIGRAHEHALYTRTMNKALRLCAEVRKQFS